MFIFCMEERKKALLQKNTLQEKSNMKSPAMYPSRKDNIPNQDINRIITKQDPTLPPIIEKYPLGYKPIFNDTHDPNIT